MSSPRSKWLPCLFCFQFHVVFLTYSLILIGSAGAENQIILLRDKNQDFFSYTDNRICDKYTSNQVYKWCQSISLNAEKVVLNPPPWSVNNTCSCLCKYNFETFLSKEGKCVNISYLKNHEDFGDDGHFEFDNKLSTTTGTRTYPANFTETSEIQLQSVTECNQCNIDKVMYLKEDQWIGLASGSNFKCHKNCTLSWNRGFKVLAGKILKITLDGCRHLSNGTLIFLKSIGRYTINVTSSPTVAPSPALKTSAHQVSNSSSDTINVTSSPTVTPSPALKTSAHQVSKFVTTPPVYLATTAHIIPSRVCSYCTSSGHDEVLPRSSSVAVLLPITTVQSATKSKQVETPSPATGAIAGAVIACGVVGGIVVLLVVLRRRRRDNTRAGKPDSLDKAPPGDSTDNPTYGKTQGEVISLPNRQHKTVQDTDEYDYATVDGDRSDHKTSKPIYQSLVKDNVQESVYTPLNKETPEDYNHLQHPVYKPPHSNSDPLYNVLEGPNGSDDYLEPGVHIDDNQTGLSEPVYNVLEDSNADNDPLYNVLEDPNHAPRDEPLYNVLEDPDDDYDNAPIADDQNPPASGQDNIAYSSTIDLKRSQSFPDYDVLEGPEGSLQDSTYQPLNIRTRNDNAPIEDADQNLPASGQDNIAYSSTIDLNIPQSPSSPDYDVLEGPEGSLPDMTYEPLSTMARDDDVYQPLDRASRYSYQPHNDPHNASTA